MSRAALRLSLRLGLMPRLLCRVRRGDRDLVLVVSAAAPRVRRFTVLRPAPASGGRPPDPLPAA